MLVISDLSILLSVVTFILCGCLAIIALVTLVANYRIINKPHYVGFILANFFITLVAFIPLPNLSSQQHSCFGWLVFSLMALVFSFYFLTLWQNLTNSYKVWFYLLAIILSLLFCLGGLWVNGWLNPWWGIISGLGVFAIFVFIVIVAFWLAREWGDNFYYVIAIVLLGVIILNFLHILSAYIPSFRVHYPYLWSALLLIMVIALYTLNRTYLHSIFHLNAQLTAVREELAQVENVEDVVISLARTIDAKDKYTEGHTERVSQYAVFLGERLNLDDERLKTLRIGALVHDIGKIGIDQDILNKPGNLTTEERAQINKHPVLGEQICSPLKALKNIGPVIRHHHERLDGSGYPDGIKGDDISLEARIVAIADVFDALTTERSYRAALPVTRAIQLLKAEACQGKLDPQLVQEFTDMLCEMGILPSPPEE
ncbi:HD-GYP domain-containing protein [Syntrophomonas erecta subsp. sporosyntropha]